MSFSSLLVTVLVYYSTLEHHGINAGVTLLVESPGPLKNSSTLESKVMEASHRESERVAQKLLLTKDSRDAWRTEKGDLVELQYVKGDPTFESSVQTLERSHIQPSTNEISGNSFADPVPIYNQGVFDVTSGIPTSHRMKRTFWPFTSLFGYDYPPPPPYGMFGPPMLPPFGGGFGMGYPGPFGPPPPLLGLGFSLGF